MIRALLLTLALLIGTPVVAQSIPEGLQAVMPADRTGRLDRILRRGTLIVGVKDDYKPWGSVNESGDLIGLEADLAADLARRMGVGLELRSVTSSNRIARVNDGQVDVVIATAGDTEERRTQADLLLPNYYSSGVVYYSRADKGLETWEDVRGAPICLNRGAYFNRALEDRYDIQGLTFAGTRESRLALLQGPCVGWAFDDTLLAQLLLEKDTVEDSEDGQGRVEFQDSKETVLVTPWSIIVAKGEGDAPLGRFVSDVIAEWLATGRIGDLEQVWGIPRSDYIIEKEAQWAEVDANGRAVCARDETGNFPTDCLASNPFPKPDTPELPAWMETLKARTGVDLSALANDDNWERLQHGIWLTLGLSAAAIVGALSVGIVLSLMYGILSGWGWFGWLLLIPQRLLVTVARMTPPILQLYIVFFGLGGTLTQAFHFTPSNFLIATVILSLYAGATNTVILSHAMDQEAKAHPEDGPFRRLPHAISRGFDGLVAACVNIVKAAGMASAIAVTEVISTIKTLVAEGADTATMMNGLLLFYFVLVLLILWLFKAARRAIVGDGRDG